MKQTLQREKRMTGKQSPIVTRKQLIRELDKLNRIALKYQLFIEANASRPMESNTK